MGKWESAGNVEVQGDEVGAAVAAASAKEQRRHRRRKRQVGDGRPAKRLADLFQHPCDACFDMLVIGEQVKRKDHPPLKQVAPSVGQAIFRVYPDAGAFTQVNLTVTVGAARIRADVTIPPTLTCIQDNVAPQAVPQLS